MQNNHVRLEKIVRYLESHLDQPVVIEELLSKFYFSKYHFHHLFRAYYGEGVYAMRKRLLLERAARSIVYGVESMTEIAFSCGYENQASFNKTIRKQFSCTPSYIRHQKTVPAFKRQQLTSFEDIKMNINVVDCKSTEVLYSRGSGKYSDAAATAWGQLMPFVYSNRLIQPETIMIGISHDDPNITHVDNIRYDACATIVTEMELPEGIDRKTILGGKYAKALHKGTYEKLSEAYRYLLLKWLPDSGFELRDQPCFEVYLNRDPRRTKPENLKTEIYIPIK
ncbi:AraC family transcriptional regulator [Vibrio atlanticus]|uniref:GyrI-like domain-containing protein n=1 Tax=Vibrio atlanticus TaxID=693153 RepID=A0ABV4KN23_9VIBR